jgi:hypothetical protein
MTDKAAYVLSEARKGPAGKHHCHWPGCERAVPPSMWGCRKHWGMLPYRLRQRIWRFFEPGQEISKRPSREYVAVAQEVQEWIANRPIEEPIPDSAWEKVKADIGAKPSQPRLL